MSDEHGDRPMTIAEQRRQADMQSEHLTGAVGDVLAERYGCYHHSHRGDDFMDDYRALRNNADGNVPLNDRLVRVHHESPSVATVYVFDGAETAEQRLVCSARMTQWEPDAIAVLVAHAATRDGQDVDPL